MERNKEEKPKTSTIAPKVAEKKTKAPENNKKPTPVKNHSSQKRVAKISVVDFFKPKSQTDSKTTKDTVTFKNSAANSEPKTNKSNLSEKFNSSVNELKSITRNPSDRHKGMSPIKKGSTWACMGSHKE